MPQKLRPVHGVILKLEGQPCGLRPVLPLAGVRASVPGNARVRDSLGLSRLGPTGSRTPGGSRDGSCLSRLRLHPTLYWLGLPWLHSAWVGGAGERKGEKWIFGEAGENRGGVDEDSEASRERRCREAQAAVEEMRIVLVTRED